MKDISGHCCGDHAKDLVSYPATRDELLALITPVSGTITVDLDIARGRVLARDIRSAIKLPPRDCSAVDGYALGQAGKTPEFSVIARTAAGERGLARKLQQGEAARIFTGAPLPEQTETVVMQEHIEHSGAHITPTQPIFPQMHIRRAGEDVQIGDMLVSAGTLLDARHVAILAAAGETRMPVIRPLRVALFSSGKELCEPTEKLGAASIHDSNRWMLKSLFDGPMIEIEDLGILPDDQQVIAATMAKAAKTADLVISTGGVSVGEEDHIFPALSGVGQQAASRRMAVKPGKPVVFGCIGETVFLGLPGNPVAAFVGFTLLARPVILKLGAGPVDRLQTASAIADFTWSRKAGRVEYFPVKIIGKSDVFQPILQKVGCEGSARLQPLVHADGLARVEQNVTKITPGDVLEWFPFDRGFVS